MPGDVEQRRFLDALIIACLFLALTLIVVATATGMITQITRSHAADTGDQFRQRLLLAQVAGQPLTGHELLEYRVKKLEEAQQEERKEAKDDARWLSRLLLTSLVANVGSVLSYFLMPIWRRRWDPSERHERLQKARAD